MDFDRKREECFKRIHEGEFCTPDVETFAGILKNYHKYGVDKATAESASVIPQFFMGLKPSTSRKNARKWLLELEEQGRVNSSQGLPSSDFGDDRIQGRHRRFDLSGL